MKRIASFHEFVNENLLRRIGSKVSQWASSFMNFVKNGLVRLIPSGPKKGKPVYMFFSGDDGSIEDQVNQFYAGTPYAMMNNINDPQSMSEAKVPLEYPIPDDVLDSSEQEIKRDIKRKLRALLAAADAEDQLPEPPENPKAFDIKPYFIFGAPGIGKTQIVSQVCDELGKELYGKRLHLSLVDGENAEPSDFSGVPKVVDIEQPSEKFPFGKGVTRSNVSVDLLPADNGPDNRGGIIFIDELNRMPEEVIRIFMKLVQGRRLGQSYKIPNRWLIVAAGNRKEDDPKNVKELGTALRDRFEVVNFVPTLAGWKSYIEGGRLKDIVLPQLIDFLKFDSEWFHNLDPAVKKTKYPTPRAWVDASLALKETIDELKKEAQMKGKEFTTIPDGVIIREFQKQVGKEAAVAFLNFYKVAKDIPVKDLILPFTDPDKAPNPFAQGKNRPDYTHALFGAVMRKSTEIPMTVEASCNFAKWLGTVGNPEFGSSAITSFFRLHPDLKKNAEVVKCLAPLIGRWQVDLDLDI